MAETSVVQQQPNAQPNIQPTPGAPSEPQVQPSVLSAQGNQEAPPSLLSQQDVKYEFKIPDGIEINKEVLGKFEGLARGLNLKTDQAQPLVDLWVEATHGYETQAIQAWVDQGQQWEQEIKSDSQIGGARFNESLALAKKGLGFAGKEFAEYIESSGLGNNPQVFRMLMKIGKSLSEDRAGFNENPPPDNNSKLTGEQEQLAKMYPRHAEYLRSGK